MNEEALQQLYVIAQGDGYSKSFDDFKILMSSNEDALNTMYGLAQSEGYQKGMDDFKVLVGFVKKKEDGILAGEDTVTLQEGITSSAFVESNQVDDSITVDQEPFKVEDVPIEEPVVFDEFTLNPKASRILSENKIEPTEAFDKFKQWKAGEVDSRKYSWDDEEFSGWVETDWAGGKTLGTSIDVTGEGDFAPKKDDFEQRVTESLVRDEKEDPLLGRSEEYVVPTLNQQFQPYGFTFEEASPGFDAMTVYGPEGQKEYFNLDSFFDSTDKKETERLKKFLRGNKKEKADYDAVINEVDLDNRFKALREEERSTLELMTSFKEKEAELLEQTKFIGDEKGKEEELLNLEIERNEVISKVENYINKESELNRITGEYTQMKGERGKWGFGAFHNALLDGYARMSANGANVVIDLLKASGVPLTDEITDSGYRHDYMRKLGLEPFDDASPIKKRDMAVFLVDSDGSKKFATYDEITMIRTLERKWKERTKGKSAYEILTQEGFNISEEEAKRLSGLSVERQEWDEFYEEVEDYARDRAAKDVKYGDIDPESGRREGGMLKELREGLREVAGVSDVTREWTDLKKQDFWGGALLGVTESIPAMIGGSGVAGFAQRTAQMYSQVSDHLYEEMERDPDFEDISENEKALFVLPVGGVVGALESLGLRGIAKNSTFLKGVLLKALQKAPSNVSARSFQQIVASEIESGIARGVIRVTSAGLVEFETGFMQEVADITGKKIYNEIKGKELFTTPDGLKDGLNQALRAGAQEAIGGFVLGTPGAIAEGVRTNDMRSVDDVTFELYEKMVEDPNYRKIYEQDLAIKVAKGIERVGSIFGVTTDGITKKEAEARLQLYDKLAGVIKEMKIASDFTTEQKKEALGLMLEKQDLKNEMSQLQDDLLKKKKKEQIEEVDSKLAEILYEGKGQAAARRQTTAREFEEGMEVISDEVVTFEFEEGQTPEQLQGFEGEVIETEEGQPNKVKISVYGNQLIDLGLATEKKMDESDADIAAFFGGKVPESQGNVSIAEGNTVDSKTKNKFVERANQVASALSKVVPGLKIQLHDNYETARGILEESDDGAYISGTIHINMSKAKLAILYHEALHAVLKSKLKVNDKIYDATVNMANAVKKVLSKGITSDIESRVEEYRQTAKEQLEADNPGKTFTQEEIDREAFSSEEYLAMAVEFIADNYGTLKTKEKSLVKRWIAAIADFIGMDVDLITKSDEKILDFINDLNKSLATGRKLTDTSALEKAAKKKGKPTTKEEVETFEVESKKDLPERYKGKEPISEGEVTTGKGKSKVTYKRYTFKKIEEEKVKKSKGPILLAPNGKRSNLNEVQWNTVRTPEFKRWFGDWENDPENASKVVDENGEPLVVYHGSPVGDITEFDRDKSGRISSGIKELGLYFATNPNLAQSYRLAELSEEGKKEVDRKIKDLQEKLYATRSNREFDRLSQELENLQLGRIYPVFLNIRDMVTFDAKGEVNIDAWDNLVVEANYKTATGRHAMEFLSPNHLSSKGLGVEPVNGIKAENIIDKSIGTLSSARVYKETRNYKKAREKYLGDAYLLFDGQPENAKLADGTNRTFDPTSRDIRKSRYFKDMAPRLVGAFLNQIQDDKDGGMGVYYFNGDMNISTSIMSPEQFLAMSNQRGDRAKIEKIKEEIKSGRKLSFPRIDYKENIIRGVDQVIAAKELGQMEIPVLTVTPVSIEAKNKEIERITKEAIKAVGKNPGKVFNHIIKVQGISATALRESISKSAKFKELMGKYVPTLREIGERYGMNIDGYVSQLISPADLKKMTNAFKEQGYIIVKSEKNRFGEGGDFYLTNQAGYKVNPMAVVKKSKAKVDISKKDLEKFARLGINNPLAIQAINQIGNISFTKDQQKNVKIAEEAIEKSYKELSDKSDTYVLSQDSPGLNGAIQGDIDAAIQDGLPDWVISELKRALRPGEARSAYIGQIAAQQKESINQWLSYFEQSDYSPAFKYLLLDAILTTNYDVNSGKYIKRNNKTSRGITPFDAAALAEVDALVGWSSVGFDEMDSAVELGAEKSVQAPILELYVDAQIENARRFAENNAMVSTDKGRWIKFDGGSRVSLEIIEENARQLMALVQDTYWCTKTSGKSQLMDGDFYVYVEDLADGGIRPMIAVRMEGDKVGEVRGNESRKQDLSAKMLPITEDFLKEHIPDDSGKKWLDGIAFNKKAKDFLEKVKDMPTIDTDTYMEYIEILEEGPMFNTNYGENAWVEKIQKEVNKKPTSPDIIRHNPLSDLEPSSLASPISASRFLEDYNIGDKIAVFDYNLISENANIRDVLRGDYPVSIPRDVVDKIRPKLISAIENADVLYGRRMFFDISLPTMVRSYGIKKLNATKIISEKVSVDASIYLPNLETISGTLILEGQEQGLTQTTEIMQASLRRDNPMISLPSLKTVKGALKLKTSRLSLPKLEDIGRLTVKQADTDIKIPNLKSILDWVFVGRDVASNMEERNKGIYLNSLEYVGEMHSDDLTEGSTQLIRSSGTTPVTFKSKPSSQKIINAPKLKKITKLYLGSFTSEINEALIQPEGWLEVSKGLQKKKALSLTKSLSKVESIDVISIPAITTGLYKLNLEGVKRIGDVYVTSPTLNELHLNINAPKLENTPTTNYEGIAIVGPKKPTDIRKSLKAFVPDPKNTRELFDMIGKAREEGFKDEKIRRYLSFLGYNTKEINLGLRVEIDELNTLPPSFAEIEGGAYEGLKLYHGLGKKVKKGMTEEQKSEVMIEELIKSKQYKDAGDPKKKKQKTSLQLRMEYELANRFKLTQTLAQRMRMARLVVRERAKGDRDIKEIQAYLRNFLRTALPKGQYVKLGIEDDTKKIRVSDEVKYKKTEIDKLMSKINSVKNQGQAEQILAELEIFVAEKNSKILINELNKKLARKTTVSESGKKVGKTLDIIGQRMLNMLKTSGMILPINKNGKISANFDTIVRNVLGLEGNKKPTEEQMQQAIDFLVKKNEELVAELNELENNPLPFKQASDEEIKRIAKDYGISEEEAREKFADGIIKGREEEYLYTQMALEAAININNAALMDSDNPNRVASLEAAIDRINVILSSSEARMRMDLARKSAEYQRQFALAYASITGIKIDPTNEESIKNLRATNKALGNRARKRTIRSQSISVLRNIKNVFATVESLPDLLARIDKLPGQLFGGTLEQEFADMVDASTIEFKRRWMQQQIEIKAKMRELYGPNWRKKARKYSRPQKTGIILEGEIPKNLISLTDKELELILSQNQMYYWYNQYKDPANAKTFEKMFAIEIITKEDTAEERQIKEEINRENAKKIMSKIESLLEAEVKEFADWQVNEYFPSVYEHYNRTYQKVYRTDMPWNQHYAGRLYREGKVDDGLNLLAKEKDRFNKSVAAASTKFRTANTNEILPMDGTSALLTYTRDMEYFAAMAETLRDVQKVFTNKDIKQAIKATHGDLVNRLIDSAINKVATKGVENTLYAKIINYMGTSFIISRLAISPVVMIKQLTSSITYANDIGIANWLWYVTKDGALGRATQAALGNREKTLNVMKEIKENSVYMQDRGFNSIFKVIENYSDEKMVSLMPNATQNFFVNALMFTTTLGDKAAIFMGGIPNYLYYKDQVRKKNPKYTDEQVIKEAIRKFERDTKKTQQSSDIQDKDVTQTGIFRPFNMFLTTPRQYLRKEIRAWRGMSRHIRRWMTRKSKREGLPVAHGTFIENLRQFAMYHIFMPAFYQWVASGFPNMFDADEEDKDDMFRAMIIGNLNALFIIGEIVEGIGDAATGKPWFDDVRGLPAVTIALQVVKKFKKSNDVKDPKLKEKYMMDAIAELTTLIGIPAPTALKFKRNYEKIISEGGSMSDKELLLRILNYSDYAATKESMEEQEPIVVGGGKYDALDIEKDRFEDRVFEDRFETNRF